MTANRSGEAHMRSCLYNIYNRLLADISHKSKVTIVAPDDIDISWVLIEGPLLDKQLLGYIEGRRDYPSFPEWVQPITEKFRSTKDPVTLRYIRQLLVFCYKAEFEPTNEHLKKAEEAYKDVEVCNHYWSSLFNNSREHKVLHTTARQDVAKVIANIPWSQISPKHGPGAVWPSCPVSEKSNWDTIYSCLEEVYPFWDNHVLLPSQWGSRGIETEMYLREADSITCNLVAVPKDSRGPRIICVHPKEAIWIQQGQRKLLEAAIERHPLTSGKINFQDQTVNGQLALHSSADGTFCTLDLKDASDRLTCSLVKFLFGGAYKWIGASRASSVRLFSGEHIRMEKYAPMGNCLTFPVQSLCFFALVRAGIRCLYGVDCREVYVFGDDILFPSKYYDGAVYGLTASNLAVNYDKTFRQGLFRESCGVDAFNGVDVTPHRLKKWDPSTVSACQSLCALAKAMRMDGYDETSAFLYSLVAKQYGTLPLSNDPRTAGIYEYVNQGLGYILRYGNTRYNEYLQRWEVETLATRPLLERALRDDWYHLQDSLIRLEGMNPQLLGGGLTVTSIDEQKFIGPGNPFLRVLRGKLEDSWESSEGLEYPVPYRERLTTGWTPILTNRFEDIPEVL